MKSLDTSSFSYGRSQPLNKHVTTEQLYKDKCCRRLDTVCTSVLSCQLGAETSFLKSPTNRPRRAMSTGDKQGAENGRIVTACYIWKPTKPAKKQCKRTMLMSNRKLIYQGVIPAPNKRVTTSSSKRRDGKFPRCTGHRMPWPKVRKCYIRPHTKRPLQLIYFVQDKRKQKGYLSLNSPEIFWSCGRASG